MNHTQPENMLTQKPASCKTGADMWREYKSDYGVTEARGICNRYLDMQIHNNNPEELRFCKELYAAMDSEPIVRQMTTKQNGSLLTRLDNSKKEAARAVFTPKGQINHGPDL